MATMMIWELNEAYWERGTISATEYVRQLETSRKATRRRAGFLSWRRSKEQWERLNQRHGAG